MAGSGRATPTGGGRRPTPAGGNPITRATPTSGTAPARDTPTASTVRQPIRVGIIGCGAIAQIAHLPILARVRGARITALCDIDGAKVRTLSERFSVPDYFTDIDELLDADVMDAAVIATPNHLHEPHALSALRANLDVLVERPLAMTSHGVERLITAAARTGRKLVASNPFRFRADVQALARFLRGGELGRVQGVRAGAYNLRGTAADWRLRRAEAGGGAFVEHGYALVDLALWLTDYPQPQRVSAHWIRESSSSAVESTMVALVTCDGGFAYTFNVTWNYVGERDRWAFEVLATSGSARLAPLRVVKDINGRPVDVSPGGGATRDGPLMQSHRAELAHFVSVLHGDTVYDPPTEQLAVLRLIDAAYRSADRGAEVTL
jgi:predicted dehydrogenase